MSGNSQRGPPSLNTSRAVDKRGNLRRGRDIVAVCTSGLRGRSFFYAEANRSPGLRVTERVVRVDLRTIFEDNLFYGSFEFVAHSVSSSHITVFERLQ